MRINSEQYNEFALEDIEKLKKTLDLYTIEVCKKYNQIEDYEFSDDFKRNINKLFKEIGIKNIPHPEVEKQNPDRLVRV